MALITRPDHTHPRALVNAYMPAVLVIKKNTVKSNGSYGIYVYQGIKVIKNTAIGNGGTGSVE